MTPHEIALAIIKRRPLPAEFPDETIVLLRRVFNP